MRKKWLVRLTLLAAVIALTIIALDQRLIVRTYAVEHEKIEVPVRLAVLTDYHGCDYGEDAADLVQAVKELQPDVVLLVGDIFDDVLSWDESEALVQSLASQYPCYYVTGNHEYWSKSVAEICRIITDAGATVLNQACAELTVNGQRLNICGIPDPYANVDTWDALTSAVSDMHQEGYTILMAHRPELIDKYAANDAFDLVVSGHAHGGQVRIPFLVNGLCAPNQGWFPKYAGGLYEVDGTMLIVSRGLSTQRQMGVPRVFNRPELVVVHIQ